MDMDLKSFIGGCFGGFAGIISSYPFDTIKVRIQNQKISNVQYRGAIDCLKKTIKHESTRALYKGISSPLIGSMFINAICFGVEENVRKFYVSKDHSKLSVGSLEYYKLFAVSGALAGFSQSIFLTPVELVKIKMQIPQAKYVNTFECVKGLLRNGGFIFLMRGYQSTLLRDMPSVATYFVSFEYLCNYFKRKKQLENNNKSVNGHDNLSLGFVLLAGGISGCLSWFVTYPIDVIKTRFQAEYAYKSYFECYRATFKCGGFRIFWRGLAPTLLRAFPNNAAVFATVVAFNRLINRPVTNDDNWDTPQLHNACVNRKLIESFSNVEAIIR